MRQGPWLLQLCIGPEEARRIGGNGRLSKLDFPDLLLGPFVLDFDLEGYARLTTRGGEAEQEWLLEDVYWSLDVVSGQEVSRAGLPPGCVFLELQLMSQSGLKVMDDSAESPREYLPETSFITANLYIQPVGNTVRMVGPSALTVRETQWFLLDEKKIIGSIGRFLPSTFVSDLQVEDPDVKLVILEIEGRLRDSVLEGSVDGPRKVLRQLLLEWHPDKQPDNPEIATKVFQWLQAAKAGLD